MTVACDVSNEASVQMEQKNVADHGHSTSLARGNAPSYLNPTGVS